MADRIVLVGTDDGIQAIGTDLARMPAGHAVGHITVADDGVWAITDNDTLWHDPGRGEGRPVATLEEVRANCVATVAGRVLVGGAEASLFELVGGELVRVAAFDDAPGRDSWFTPWGGPPDVRSIAIGVDGDIYVNVHVGGVLRSDANGAGWHPTLDIQADVHQVVTDERGTAHAAAAIGLGVSDDGGANWSFETTGLHGSYCRAVAVSESNVFVSASRGSGGREAALYRRPRSGGWLERCTRGLPEWFSTNLDTFCLAALGRLVVAADADGTVYASHDDGDHWDVVAEELPGVHCVGIV